MAAAGLAAGALLGAGGSIGGGFLAQAGGLSEGDMILPTFDPRFDPSLVGQEQDALGLIGLRDVNRLVTPLEEIINKINALPKNTKQKRRAMLALQQLRDGVEPEKGNQALDGILKMVGMDRVDLQEVFDRDTAFREQRQRLSDAGLGGMQEQTILSRAQAQANAAEMLAAAGQFGATGEAQNPQQQAIMDRIQRTIDDTREAALLRAEHAKFNPAIAEERLVDAELDKGLQGFLESLQQSVGITQALSAGLKPAQHSAAMTTTASNNALSIAAQQAMASNQLANANSMNDALSMASGVSGGAQQAGQGAMAASILGSSAPAATPPPPQRPAAAAEGRPPTSSEMTSTSVRSLAFEVTDALPAAKRPRSLELGAQSPSDEDQ
jgi:hypothetical protein